MKTNTTVVLGAALLAFASTGYSHHSGAMFDSTREQVLVGTITEFNWTNPHSSFKVDVVDAEGKTATWAIEMGSPQNLVHNGWKRTTIKQGDKVSVRVRPLRDGKPGGSYVSITLANGQTLGGSGGTGSGNAEYDAPKQP